MVSRFRNQLTSSWLDAELDASMNRDDFTAQRCHRDKGNGTGGDNACDSSTHRGAR